MSVVWVFLPLQSNLEDPFISSLNQGSLDLQSGTSWSIKSHIHWNIRDLCILRKGINDTSPLSDFIFFIPNFIPQYPVPLVSTGSNHPWWTPYHILEDCSFPIFLFFLKSRNSRYVTSRTNRKSTNLTVTGDIPGPDVIFGLPIYPLVRTGETSQWAVFILVVHRPRY